MSLTYLEKIECPCGESFESELFQSISVHEDPDLRDKVLAGEINVVKCPSCFQMVYAERFVLYHDPEDELMAFVYPKGTESRREEIQAEMARAFSDLQAGLPPERKIGYKPFLVFGMDELCGLLRAEEERADEAAVADALCDSLRLQKKKIQRDLARRLGIPALLPLSGKPQGEGAAADLRQRLLRGLREIVAANDRLEHYRKMLEQVEADPNWSSGVSG